jgi:hypothetical protein
MSAKLKEFTAEAHLSAVGNSKGYIFKHDLLAEAGVKPGEAFRVLVTTRKIIFEYTKTPRAGKIVPRPLSYYLKPRKKGAEPVAASEIWPDDAPRGKEALG